MLNAAIHVTLILACGAVCGFGTACEVDRSRPAPAETVASAVCSPDSSAILLPTQPEASGVAASGLSDGILWGLNDSGGATALVAFDRTGRTLGNVTVAGAVNEDWEDLALAPCGSASCLYAADIGDNRGARPFITVYRVPQPSVTAAATGPAVALRAKYPDGARNAEAFFVLAGERLYIISKGDVGDIALYQFPDSLAPAAVMPLRKLLVLGTAQPRRGRVTGADASPDGQWVVIRTYGSVTFYHAEELAAGRRNPVLTYDISSLGEPQGEGVALLDDGTVFLTSEGANARAPGSLRVMHCSLPRSIQ